MKKYVRAIVLVLVTLSLANVCFPQNEIEAGEYAVISDLIRQTEGDEAKSRVAFHKMTTAESIEDLRLKYLNRKLSPLGRDLIEDFNCRNTTGFQLQDHFNLKAKVYLLEDELKDIFKTPRNEEELIEEKDWEEFRRRYQTFSIHTISRVGFNRKQTVALVEMGSQYGYLAGQGFYYLLIKTDNGWKIRDKVQAWIS